MKLSELIAAYGDDKVGVQNLDQCVRTLAVRKGVTTITFGTEEEWTSDGTERLGLVVWLDRKRVKEIVAASKTPGGSDE